MTENVVGSLALITVKILFEVLTEKKDYNRYGKKAHLN
jgi:hypothetical protein